MSWQRIADNVKLGKDVIIRDFVNLYGCTIGDNCRIGTFVEIQKNATIGSNTKVSSHTFICEGVTIEEDVFIGHNVSFINDKYPLLGGHVSWQLMATSFVGAIAMFVVGLFFIRRMEATFADVI